MKQFFIGCGVAVVAILVLVGGCLGYFGYKTYQWAQGLESIEPLYNELDEKYPFTAPADYTMNLERFEAFLVSREEFHLDVNKTPIAMAIMLTPAGDQINLGIRDILGVFPAMNTIPRNLAETLESQQMSAEEFRFYLSMLYLTIDEFSSDDPEFQELKTRITDSLIEVRRILDTSNVDVDFGTKDDTTWEGLIDLLRSVYPANTNNQTNKSIVTPHIRSLMRNTRIIFADLIFLKFMKDVSPQGRVATDE